MSFYSHKTTKQLHKTIFTALFYTVRRFVDTRIFYSKTSLLVFLLLLSFGGIIAGTLLAKNDSAFRPLEESLHIFPSIAESDFWHNIDTLGSQDVSEDELSQSFTRENSAYIDPTGALPSDVVTSNDTTATTSQDADVVQPPTLNTQNEQDPSLDNLINSSTSSTSTIGAPVQQSDEVELPVEVPVEPTEAVDETSPTEVSDPPVETEPEPTVEEPAPENEPAAEDNPIISFFKRVTGSFYLTQAATTSAVSDEVDTTFDEPESTDLEEDIVNETVLGTSTASSDSSEEVLQEQTPVQDVGVVEEESKVIDLETNQPTATSSETSDLPTHASTSEAFVSYDLTLTDFGIPTLASGQFINNLQLRLSLGGQYEYDASSTLATLDVDYSFGSFEGEAGSILLDGEISNAMNGGYYLVPLPSVTDAELLSDLVVTITFNGELSKLEGLFLDAAWVEVGTVVYDKNILKQRHAPDTLTRLKTAESMEFLGDTLDFTRNETPKFSMRYHSQRNIAVQAVRSVLGKNLVKVHSAKFIKNNAGPISVRPDVTVTPEGLITVLMSDEDRTALKPGLYTLEIEVAEGGYVTTDSFEFQWGMLAINSNQTEYTKGDIAQISMGALSSNGNTVCEAKLDLYVIDPRGFISRVPVVPSGECNGNNVVDVPDYSAQFVTDFPGTYEMYLERMDDTGTVIGHTNDTFEVVSKQDIALVRNGPTRIYPLSPYTMEMDVRTFDNSFSGTIVERVPHDFDVFNTEATINRYADFTELVWDMSLLGSTTKRISYEFDAPDISPFLYELGPATVLSDKKSDTQTAAVASSTASTTEKKSEQNSANDVVLLEHRKWQIASDAVGSMILYWDNASAIPNGWTCLSCGSGTFYQRFAVGSSTYNNTGGVASHTPSANGSVIASTQSDAESFSGTTVDSVAHSHPTYTPTIASASNLPSYRQLRVIQRNSAGDALCDGDETTCIPTGAIGMFDVASSSLPSGWNRYAAQDGYYVYAENTPGTTSGSNTHTHAISGTTAAATGALVGSRGGGTPGSGAPAGHTHTVSSSTPSINNEPPYIEVLFAKIDATSTSPNNLIAMWSEDVDSGWLDVSSTGGDPFNNKFVKGASVYGATGGTENHVHSDVSGITSSGPSGTAVSVRTGTAGAAFAHTHAVNVTGFSTDSNIPPYISVVFGKKQGTNPVYTQESYRWYTNQNAQIPTDPWPLGASDLGEAVPINVSTTLVKNDDQVRLRMNVSVQNATATAGARFKLQYAATDACAAGTWSDVGDTASSTLWRGYNNSSVADHSTLASTTLASTTIAATYEENGYASSTPNDIPVADVGEWDYVLEHNGALAGTNYCFRMVEDDGSSFLSYTSYAQMRTNTKPDAPTLLTLFDNEKTASTSVTFTFVASDDEGEKVDYQIQVDDDAAFGSTLVDDTTSPSNNAFSNIVSPSEKAPYSQNQAIQFNDGTSYTNGSTYWWRVRSRDIGSDEWSDWATPKSFTIDTSLTVSAWHQTTEAQFDTNTLINLETPAADYVALTGGSATGTMTSTGIDFDDGVLGTAWGRLYFTESDASAVINYKVQYLTDAATWALIPDTDLPGNSTGFTATTSLLNLDTSTYNTIRIIADVTGSAGSPQVADWTVEWGYRVETPTISKLFPNEKTGTTTPTFQFTTTDPQSDDLTYQVSWSTDNTFVSSTTRTSDVSVGFYDVDADSTVDPFASGNTIQFTVQPADALSDGTTYWWRVRAKDTTGDDVYSLWTDMQSFTVATDTAVSTWFQTTEEQFDSNILSGTIALTSDDVSVATTASEALIVYGENVATAPRYRQWDGSTWSDEGQMQDVGAVIKWAVVKAGTQREEYVAGTIGNDADLNVQVFSTGAWGTVQEMTTNVGSINARGFDIAYEPVSGDAMVAYCDGDTDPSYRIWNGSSWSVANPVGLTLSGTCEWVQLASHPSSDEIILMARDSGGASYSARVWNGSAWGNTNTFGGIIDPAHEGMAVAYEGVSGDAVIITSDGNPARFRYDTWVSGAWVGAGTQTIGDDFEWGRLVSDVGSDELALCYQDEDTNIGMVRWTGSAWAGQVELLTTTGKSKADPGFACVFEEAGARDNYILTTFTDTTQTNYNYWDNTSWLGTSLRVSGLGDTITSKLTRTGTGLILGTFFDETNDALTFLNWNGTTWGATTTIEDNMSVGASPYGHPYDVAARNDGRAGTTIVSPGINFSDGVGPYWQEMSWVDTTPVASDILYSVQYYDGDSWEFVPDTDIPGNSVGTSTSPIDLSGLNITTYNQLRPYASLSCDGSGNCPTLHDWTITWAEGITVSGTIQDYSQSIDVTSGSVAVAVDGVLQIGKTGSISGGAWTINNVTTFPGSVITVFVTGAATSSRAVGVTRYDGIGNITGMQLFEHHLSLGSDDATTTPFTNADVGSYTSGADVFMSLAGSTLNVCGDAGCEDVRLFINASTTFTPGGPVTTHDLQNEGTLVATSTLYVSGSWANTATTTMTGSTVVFEATSTTETVDSTGAAVSVFNTVTFGTTTGNATWTLSSPLDVDGNMTVSRGTLSRANTPITVAGNILTGASGFWAGIGTTTFDGTGTSNWADQNAVLQNTGNVVIDGTSKSVVLNGNVAAQNITIGSNDIFDVSIFNYDVTVYDSWYNSNIFTARDGEVFFAATSTSHTITAGNDAFYDLSFTGVGGSWSFTESELTVDNDFTVATGTVTMPTATTTIAGSFSSVGGTFAHNNSVITFTSSGAETIAASGTVFTNAFYNLYFNGLGSWTFTDTNATTSHDISIPLGTVTFPSGTFTVGGSLRDTGGAFVANGGTVLLTSTAAELLQTGGSSLNNVTTLGTGSWSFVDTNATIAGDLTISAGTFTLPSGVLSLGGSLLNTATLTHNGGQITFNSSDTGETIDVGSSSLYDVLFDSVTGGWTIAAHATATNSFTLATSTDFTLASGQVLAVGNSFTNSMNNASTTWTGSTLSLYAGTYSINTKTDEGDAYATLAIGADTDIAMWNSSATTYLVQASGSLYSQDHAGADGALNIYGTYDRTNGTEYWSYATDFDGTDITGSERQAVVRFASGASASLTDSTLEMLGTAAASTTVQNQGSGTYTVSLTGGTTTAQHYAFDDLGTTGLSLLGGVAVTSLLDGSFTVAAPGGTGITLSSTTIDANPAKQIYRVAFATTTAIAASNITQNDGSPASYWWFRESAGNLDGEAFDADAGDPGSVRWDDSSLVITIAGTVFTDDGGTPLTGGTCDGVTTPVRVVVEGGGAYDGSCSNIDGSYSVGGVVVVGDPVITVFLNDATGGEQAVMVTKTPTSDVLDADLYANRVITRHEDIVPLTIADMAIYDVANDSDISFTAATGTTNTLNVSAGNELYVWATTTFAPGGDISLHGNAAGTTYDGSLYIDNGATFEGSGTSTYSVGGVLTLGGAATFVPASTTVLMTATTTGKAIVTEAAETLALHELQFVGTGGSWNINGNISATGDVDVTAGIVTGTGDITLSNGSISGNGILSLGGGTVTIEKSNTLGGTTPWTFYNLTLGSGSVAGTTTPPVSATTTIGGVLTIANAHFLDAGASNWNLAGSGSVFVETGTFLEDTSTVTYSGTAATNLLATNYYNMLVDAAGGSPTFTATGVGLQVFNDLSIGTIGTTTVQFDTNDVVLNIDGDLYIGALGTFVGSNSATFTLGGSYENDGTFIGSGGTLTFDGSGVHTIAPGVSSFSSVVVDGTGDFTVTEHATATNAWTLTNANDFTLASSQILAVGGTFTNSIGGADTVWTGSTLSLYGGGNYEINASTTADTYGTIAVAPNTHIRMWNSDAAVIAVDGTGSLYSMDHNTVDGDLSIYGAYRNTSTTDYWSYATDFDGTDLSGSGERQVTVSIENGGGVTYAGSAGLTMIGTAAASTTVQNQGSGTYAFTIGGTATANFSRYAVRDLDINGLVFTATPSITSISYGDHLVDVNNGSAITVGGTTINANPAKTFTNNIFASSSGITATNVTATGTSVSSWRFTNHTGNIDGEGFDSDPDGDPGYLVWDDSAANITVSGNVYSDEGTTVSGICDGSTNNVHVRVAGLTSYTTSCDASTGLYAVNGVTYSPGDSLVAYIDGESVYAANVTADMVSNINNMHLYENRVIVRHENTDPLSIADMAVWDSSDDPDIPFTAINAGTDTLTLPANRKLIVWNSKAFAPAGNITLTGGGGGAAYDGTLELFSDSTFTAASGQAHSIGGSLISDTNAVFTADTASVTFTTTGVGRTIDINDASFYDVVFNGSGSWSITDAILSANDLTITAGDVTLPTGTTTISGSLDTTGGTFDANSGIIIFTATGAETIRASGSDFASLSILGSGSFTMQDTNATATESVLVEDGTLSLPSGTFAVGGDFKNNGGAITHNTSLIILTNVTEATLLASSSDLYGVTVSGGGTYTMEDNSLTLLDSLTVSSGSLTLASGTLSIGGSFDASGGTFDNATGTILFNSSDTGETIDPGVSPFYNVNIAGGSGGWTITADATTTNNFTLASAANFTQQSGTTLTVSGVFTNAVGGAATTWNGSTLNLISGNEYAMNAKTTGGDRYDTLVIADNTDISAWNSAATTTTVAASGSFYSQDHAAVDGALNIYGDYHISTTTEYWSYATDFDGTALGGSPRAVTVSIAANATTSLDGGVVHILGASLNETTITNQGSGTYAFNVSDGTFNAQYYAFRNLNATGLNLSSSPVITSLSYGDFELAVDTGALINLSSTTLNANASLVITGTRFATTSAISGTNVYLTGTTPSAWTFVSHTGNLSGEDFDVDGGDACSSVRWDDSQCLITQQTHYRWRNDDGGIGVPAAEWYDTNWDARSRIRIDNVDATSYTDSVIKLTIPYDADMQSDFDDLRFTDDTGVTEIPYFIASSTNSVGAEVWVKVPSLPSLDMATIFMYYKNAAVSGVSSSTATFIAADDFEDGDISEYSGDTSLFAVDGSFAYGGSYGLDNTGNESEKATDGIGRTDQTVSQGEIIRYMQYVKTGTGDEVCTLFGVQGPVTANQNYGVCIEQVGTPRIALNRNVENTDSSGTSLSSTDVTTSDGWYAVEIDWQTDDTIDVALYDEAGTLVATTSANDGTYTSGGFGFTYWFNNGGWDNFTSRPRVETEPTITYGAEQTDGGASWAAAIDTQVSNFSIGDSVRLRFAVENTGLSVTDAYQLEYAEQGAAPSCEAVNPATYSVVEPAASCGTDPICMDTSATVANGANTTDLLIGPAGTFIPGKFVEDPSNTAASLTVDQDEYTEIEYAITPTIHVVDQNLCFRVSDSGSDLDTYLRVAKMSVKFDPSFGIVTLNNGDPISLIEGTTTRVYATSTVTDLNGYEDIVAATSTFYTTSATAACTPDNNDCYITTATSTGQCSFTSCAGNSCVLECYADIYYHADPTDNDGGEEWFAFLEAEDASGGGDFGTSIGVELLTLRALSVDSEIDYGALEVTSDTGADNASTTVQNIGNDPIDVQIVGDDLSDGGTSLIEATYQKFATTSFTYSACVSCTSLSTSSINYDLNLGKPTSDAVPVEDAIYWGIAVPFGTKSNPHSGVNTFYAIGDS